MAVNKIQRITIIIGAVVFITVCLIPPWTHTFQEPGMAQARTPGQYAPLVEPPEPKRDHRWQGVEIDVVRLGLTLLIVVVGTGAVVVGHSGKPAGRDQESRPVSRDNNVAGE